MAHDLKDVEFPIVESSPLAKEAIPRKVSSAVYPFAKLEVGQSFTCKLSDINWKSLRICTYQQNARSKEKQFKFIKHDDLGIVEVARIAPMWA